MKLASIILSLFLSYGAIAGDNVEINAKYVKDNKNYIYMKSDKERIKLRKKGLTKEGVKQILENKDKPLMLFVPKDSVVHRKPLPDQKSE